MQEDEDENVEKGARIAQELLGKDKVHLYPKIFQLVMADAAFTDGEFFSINVVLCVLKLLIFSSSVCQSTKCNVITAVTVLSLYALSSWLFLFKELSPGRIINTSIKQMRVGALLPVLMVKLGVVFIVFDWFPSLSFTGSSVGC